MGKHKIIESHLELVHGLLDKEEDSLLSYLVEMAILENGRRTGSRIAEYAFEESNPRTLPEPHGEH